METMKDKVAIIGMGCTRFGEHWDKSAKDLIVDAAYEAYEDAGVGPKDIQAAWIGTVNSGEVGNFLAEPLKLQYIPVTRVENRCATGTDAFRNAVYAVASGAYDICLALGVEKLKDAGMGGLGGLSMGGVHPVFEGLGGAAVPMFAQIATRYFHHYGLSYEEGKTTLAKISVKSHHNGAMNPKAHLRREISVEQVLKSPILSYPLGLFDCCGVSDGAAAAIVCRADMAKSFKDDYLLVKSVQIAAGPGDHYKRDDYDNIHFEETVRAATKAYKEAGITNPFKELDLVELHDCFSITELVTYEDLGLCPRGEGPKYVDSGAFTLEGELPVQPDGGLKTFGHPLGASGIRMLYEIYKQVQGKCGDRQIKDAAIGLAHNLGGAEGGFICSATIIGR